MKVEVAVLGSPSLKVRTVSVDVKWCMVVWCTQNLRRDGCSFMWHQPCQRCKYTTSMDIKNIYIYIKRAIKLVTHVEPHASAVTLLKRAENSAI